MVQKIKKSEATKNKLLDSLWKLILKGEKISPFKPLLKKQEQHTGLSIVILKTLMKCIGSLSRSEFMP